MKKHILSLAFLCGLTMPAAAADYAVIHLNIGVDRPAATAWDKIGGYCDITGFLKLKCEMVSGKGEVGSIRRLNGNNDEVLVAATPYSYTYTQPTTTILYHGTLEVRPVDAGHSEIHYTLFYDQAPLMTPEAQAENRKSRTTRWQAALETMKAMAEAN